MRVKPCPVCGHRKTWLLREIGNKRKPFHVECIYCHFSTGNARTMNGACKKWNKESRTLNNNSSKKEE